MNKIELCERFGQQLEEFNVEFEVFNNGYHFQIQKDHNFYPTKRSYYNSENGQKCFYPEFKNEKHFWKWMDLKGVKRQDDYLAMEKIWNDARHPKFAVMTFSEYIDSKKK